MTARYYYSGTTPLAIGEPVELDPDESRHLVKAMRVKVGDPVVVFGAGGQFSATVAVASASRVVVNVTNIHEAPPPPRIEMTFLLPWIKGGKTELVLQKLTELGASHYVIFQASHAVARGDDDKLERLRKVVVEACKQCERVDVPTVQLGRSLAAAMQLCERVPVEHRFILHERQGIEKFSIAVNPAIAAGGPVMVASGPEGGWDPAEIAAVEGGARLVSLGPRILRAETAPMAAAAALLALSGDL